MKLLQQGRAVKKKENIAVENSQLQHELLELRKKTLRLTQTLFSHCREQFQW
jgi:hypothetical protein